ncbi:MAG: N-acyl homoserine lactonase family protein [Bacteroidota bacterium]
MTRRRAISLLGAAGAGTLATGCGVAGVMRAPQAPAPPFAEIDLRVGDVRVRSVRTGAVAVKQAHRALVGPALTRLPSIVLDPRWTPWLPITAWLVEHPERTLLVDTGETPRVAEPGYFACDPGSAFVYENLLAFDVPLGLTAALRQRGVEPRDLDAVVVTHLHSDHAGGLADVDGVPALLSRTEAERPPQGALPCRWPPGFVPQPLDYRDGPAGAFEASHALTPDGTVRAVPTPGHTRGHQSVLVAGPDGETILLAGDAAFDRQQVERDEVAGICEDVRGARRTLGVLREQLSDDRTVFLASHDPDPLG